ncbi:MAG: alpha/beta hydrolase [Bacillota bacterium]
MNAKITKPKKILIISAIILAVILIACGIYLATGQYSAQERATEIFQNAENLTIQDNMYILSPETESDTAIIFYPGGKVEAISYLPLMQKITENLGVTTIIVEMPFNLACFSINSADSVINSMPEIENFYIAGHSLGSAMASVYAENNGEKLQGVIVLGGYVYGDYPKENSLTIYGSLNSNLESSITYTDNVYIIEGGNHAQFGDYGEQSGDTPATISAEEQEDITVEIIKSFIN